MAYLRMYTKEKEREREYTRERAYNREIIQERIYKREINVLSGVAKV